MWYRAPSRRGRSSIRHARPHVRTPCCFCGFWWIKDLLTNFSASSDVSCGKDTHPAEQMSLTQPAIHAPPAHFHMSFPCHARQQEESELGRRDGDNPRLASEPNGKRNAWLNLKSATKPLSKYYGARQPAPTRIFLVSCTSVTNWFFCMVTTVCFFCYQCEAVNAGGTLRLLKSLCDGTGESRQKAIRKLVRALMPNE